MRSMLGQFHFVLTSICFLYPGSSDALYIDGCPLYGCRPSSTFSFYSSVPDTISLNWQSHTFSPVPGSMGCSADSCSIICIDNGVFSNEKGYVSLYGENGTVRWRDPVLLHPTLAMLDNYGDVTGSDGKYLVHYGMDGTKFPIIKLISMRPIFSMTLVSTSYLLMISERGCLSLRDTNAIPDASIFLNATIQNTNGTFLPTSQPVVNGHRFYLLTEFVPEVIDEASSEILNVQRLYAIDVHDRMADIMTIAWTYNFEMLTNEQSVEPTKTTKADNGKENIRESLQSKQVLLWDNDTQTVYVNLPPPMRGGNGNALWTFWGLTDEGNDTSLAFRNSLPVTHMATFEANTYVDDADSERKEQPVIQSNLWISLQNGTLCTVDTTGMITRTIDLPNLLKADIEITSKVSLVRENDTSTDILLFGVTVVNKTYSFAEEKGGAELGIDTGSYVIAVNTDVTSGRLLWAFPVPGSFEVKGQVTGSQGADYQRKDQFIFYAENADTATIFSIN